MRGFTLIELLVVLALIGVLVAMVTPPLVQTYERAAARQEWHTFRGELALTARRAFAQDRAVQIMLDGKTAKLQWEDATTPFNTLAFDWLFFTPQTRDINPAGVFVQSEITATIRGRQHQWALTPNLTAQQLIEQPR